MTVRELLERIDAEEILEWMYFFKHEPWGYNVENHRWGTWMALYANAHRDPRKRPAAYEPNNFLPVDYGKRQQKVEHTKEERIKGQRRLAGLMAAAFGGKKKGK